MQQEARKGESPPAGMGQDVMGGKHMWFCISRRDNMNIERDQFGMLATRPQVRADLCMCAGA